VVVTDSVRQGPTRVALHCRSASAPHRSPGTALHGLGQFERAIDAPEQRAPDLFLERLDLVADRRLRNEQLARGVREAQVGARRPEARRRSRDNRGVRCLSMSSIHASGKKWSLSFV